MQASQDSPRKISLPELSRAVGKALAAGRSQDEIVTYLANHGWAENSAREFVNGIAQAQSQGRGEQSASMAPHQVASRPLVSPPMQTGAPACTVCGKQDETLRIVAYPFVISLIAITFRRTLTGLWCGRHRTRNLMLASLITATTGWLGIPFGLIFTPVALFSLAKGGDQPRENNSALLRAVAEHQLNAGDAAGAVRSLEASMRFDDSRATREKLLQIRSAHGLTEQQEEGCQQELRAVVRVLLSAIGIGAVIGGLDYLAALLFQALAPTDTPFLVAILSWVPLIAGVFVGGVLLAQSIEVALTRIRCRTLTLALSLGVLAAILAVYSIPQIASVADYLLAFVEGAFSSTGEAVLVGLLALVLGGSLQIVDAISVGELPYLIYLAVMAMAAVYYLWVAAQAAVQTTRWQQRIAG